MSAQYPCQVCTSIGLDVECAAVHTLRVEQRVSDRIVTDTIEFALCRAQADIRNRILRFGGDLHSQPSISIEIEVIQ